ncbi:unnamed protein product [Notodromas monacha]|uniref:Oxidation resistance protein 1 n=1 Tax=Notodromas monacha TaxID=399045 RepID=A0A7R9BUV6_9CRUS|nr:unnamed protein product [Notodromas monacha]CAG0920817.1 unnamed protein product [Notodromas monacha]
MVHYEDVKVTSGRSTKNAAASQACFQLMKATFQLGNLLGEVAPDSTSAVGTASPTGRRSPSSPLSGSGPSSPARSRRGSPSHLAPPPPTLVRRFSSPNNDSLNQQQSKRHSFSFNQLFQHSKSTNGDDLESHEINVESGCEYLDVTCQYLMKLWTAEKVATVNEDEVHKALEGSVTDNEFIPELIGESEIFDLNLRKHLIRVLPARCQGYPWKLSFSTAKDGFSLANLYRRMENVESCVLLIIQDSLNNVFGALLSHAPTIQDHSFGTGESFLFTFAPPPDADVTPSAPVVVVESCCVDETAAAGAVEPSSESAAVVVQNAEGIVGQPNVAEVREETRDIIPSKDLGSSKMAIPGGKDSGKYFRAFKWSGANSFIIRCYPDSLAVGIADGRFGLLLDGDLNKGRTDECATFENSILTTDNDFTVLSLECWSFD